MKRKYILPLSDPRATLNVVGGKGMSLSKLVNAGLPVPNGFHLSTEAYRKFVSVNNLQAAINAALAKIDKNQPETLASAAKKIESAFVFATFPDEIAKEILTAYTALRSKTPRDASKEGISVAVRSSATAEDLPDASFAGQQETYLNICGTKALLESVKKCWASLWTARAISYRSDQSINSEDVALAVVVQEMVFADAAGVLFTANPLNGKRDEMIINTAWGLGEALVGGLVTPDTLTIEKTALQILTRDIANKEIMTVRIPGGTEEQAVPEAKRLIPVLSDSEIKGLAQLALRIEKLYNAPMDIEWTLANGCFAIVQARPITALPEPSPPIPEEWELPTGAYAALRNNIVELMTDPLTPLFKTLGLQSVNASMNRTMTGFLGNAQLLPDDPIIVVNEYAYYNGSVKFWPMFKVILDTPGILKRMFTGAVERWTEVGRPEYVNTVKKWDNLPWGDSSSTEILNAAQQLSESAIDAYMALVSGVIPAAWMSEAWFTWRYKFIKRKDDPDAPTFLMGFDNLPIQSEKKLFDLATWTRNHESLYQYIESLETTELIAQLHSDQAPENVNADEWQSWVNEFNNYLALFGHAIYNLDFGNPVPADDPAPVLEAFKLFLNGEGVNPHERQKSSESRREEAIRNIESRIKGRKLTSFRKGIERAQKYAPLREDGLADVGFSYPLLRKMLREIGERFVQADVIGQIDDIFWLMLDEVEETAAQLDRDESPKSLASLIPQRKAIWQSAKKAAPPMMLPDIKLFGVSVAEIKSGGLKKRKIDSLKGIGASPGIVTAPACVLHGPEDFAKMETGAILVASLTTPAWTPLFTRASAVVTDIGGPLSHGSIVAREYGIPAVLGTGNATKRILHGQTITVNGSEGIITLKNERVSSQSAI